MANTKNTITRAMALTNAIAKFDEGDPIRATLERMLEQVNTKPTSESPTKAKEREEREALMQSCVEAIKNHPDALIDSTWLNNNVNGVTSTQKATYLMRMAAEQKLIERVYDKHKTYYKAI